jgi:uncharacterized membrane protein
MQRFPSIEYLRGVAIILMIQVHFVENLAPREVGSARLYDFSTFLGSFPAPLFTFVSGLSYCLWARKQESARRRDADITAVALRRGLFLFVVGIAFNFAVWLPEETFNWDILTLIGTALLLLAFARKLPLSILVLVCALVLLASPVLRVVGDYEAYWDDGAYTYDFNLRDILFGYIANGYFPVFPWILFPVVGFVCGDLVFQNRKPAYGWLCAAGIGLLAVAGAGAAARAWLPDATGERFIDRISEFPASTLYVQAMVGVCVLAILLLHRVFDRKNDAADGWFAASLKRFSSFSLTVYVLHHLVILWPVWIYGAWAGHDDLTYYWRRALSAPLAFGLALSFIIACHFALGHLDRHRRFSLEALMRRLCD